MKKIFNWTFGACFRTLGRFLAIFLVGVLLIFIGSKIGIELPDWLSLRVNAATTTVPNWADGLPQLSQVRYLSCSSTTTNASGVVLCNGSMTIDSNTIYTGSGTREFVSTNTNMTIGTNGYNITLANPIIAKTGYIYNISLYTCSNVSYHEANYDLFFGIGQEKNNRSTTISKNLININSQPGLESSITFNYCTRISTLVVPGADNFGWVNLRLTSDKNISGLYLSTIALEVRELGLYNGEIENIIQNSGFASAESVEQVQESVNKVEQEIQQTQDTITNEDTTGAEDSASGFFNDFTTETFGLTSIITAPLNAINSLISSTCSPLVFPLPYIDKNLSLPCMSTIYSEYFGGFFSIYQLITTGIISYYVIVRIFNLVKDFKNPDHDEIEVVDL